MTTNPDPPTADPPECVAFRAVLNRVLDGDLPPSRLRDEHATKCPDCGGLASAAQALLAAMPAPVVPPVGLAGRIVTRGVRDHRRRRLVWSGSAAVLAASVVFAAYLALPRPPAPNRMEVVRTPEPAPRVGDQLAEAGSALASLTRKAAEPVTAPTRLFPPPEAVSLNIAGSTGIEPAADALTGMPSAAKAGLEPMTSTTRRAVNLFLRDFGLTPTGKPKT